MTWDQMWPDVVVNYPEGGTLEDMLRRATIAKEGMGEIVAMIGSMLADNVADDQVAGKAREMYAALNIRLQRTVATNDI